MPKPDVSDHGPRPGHLAIYDVEELHIAAWCPTPDASGPATQVHLELHVQGLPVPLVVRFKGPETLSEVIRQLTRYRDEVWPAG